MKGINRIVIYQMRGVQPLICILASCSLSIFLRAEPLTFQVPVEIQAETQLNYIHIRAANGGALISGGNCCLMALTNDFAANTNFNAPFDVGSPFIVLDGGKILATPHKPFGGQTLTPCLVRLNQDGTIDSSFNAPEIYYTDNENFRTLAVQSDGKILVGCLTPTNPNRPANPPLIPGIVEGIFRLNENGTFDDSFRFNSIWEVRAIVPLANAKILIAGQFQTGNPKLQRLEANGSFDNTFSTPQINGNYLTAMAVQSDGKILVSGNSLTLVNDVTRFGMARFTEDGTFDPSFDRGPESEGVTRTVFDFRLQPDGRIVVAYSGVSRFFIDGRQDPGFRPKGRSWVTGPQTVDIDSSGRIYTSGEPLRRFSGEFRVQIPAAEIPVVLEKSSNLSGSWSPLRTIPANTPDEYIDPSFPFQTEFFRLRPAN